MADDSATWALIHRERAALADTLDDLTADDWTSPSLCDGWSVKVAAAHVVAGAEQTRRHFAREFAASGFRFDTAIDRKARKLGALDPSEIVARLRAGASSTTRPPAPLLAMLGEIVVHSEDIRRPVGRTAPVNAEAVNACLDMYTKANYPVGGKRRIAGLRLATTDTGWTYGDGPLVSGPGQSLVLAMTGRDAGLADLTGDGVATLRSRLG